MAQLVALLHQDPLMHYVRLYLPQEALSNLETGFLEAFLWLLP